MKKATQFRVSQIRVSQIRASQIRATQIKATQIRETEISSNQRELHGAIFVNVGLLSAANSTNNC